jgi:hypothetical protein
MKLSPETLTILKNFTAINKGIVFHPGNKLYSRKESLIADATIFETWEKEVGIFDLSQLLNIIGLYDDAVLDFGDDCLRIAESDGRAETKYVYAAPGIVSGGTIPKKKLMEVPEEVIEFNLTEEQWTKLQKAISILSKPEVKIVSDGKVIRIETANHKDEGGSSFSVVLEGDPHGIQCRMVYNRDDMPLLKGSYKGTVTPQFTIFQNTSGYDLKYLVGVEPTTSKFGSSDDNS